MKHTLVIVGAGLAGLSAALTAVKNGWTVKLVSSLASERAQSVMAEGGINAALNTKGEEDSPEQHYTDTLTAACGLADPNAVWGMTQAASELVRSLHHLGVQFNVTDDDELDLRNFGGQKKKRTAFAQSDTGKQLMTALIDAVRREESAGTVERFPHHKFRTLLLSGNICGGCTVQDTYTGELLRFVCDAVLIATGGLHGLFGDTTGSLANTGEVTAELFRLGVPMANLEMIQYHPTTVELGEKRMLLSEAARGEGGRLFALRNGKPWYFMEEKYPELGNLMPRDITAREVWTVSRDYEVFLDMTELPKEVMEHKLAGLVDDCQTYLHKDIRKEPMHDFDTSMFFRWIFKSAFAILIVSNTWNIVMGVFDATQSVVNQSSGVIIGETSIHFDRLIPGLEFQLESMTIGSLLSLWFQTLVVGLTMNILSICIFLVTYGRMIEIYVVTALGPIPLATMGSSEWRSTGQNYLKSLLALGFQAFLIMIVVGIYAVLIRNISGAADIAGAIWGCMGYTVLLCFCLFKTGSISKSVFGAH